MRTVHALFGLASILTMAAGCAAPTGDDAAAATSEDPLIIPRIPRFTFQVDQVFVSETRALVFDADDVMVQVTVNGAPIAGVARDLGIVDSGIVQVNLASPTFYAASGSHVSFSFTVTNDGHARGQFPGAIDCDGVVASDTFSFLGGDLASYVPAGGGWGEWVHYPGTTSPVGCGPTSDYWVHWSYTRVT